MARKTTRKTRAKRSSKTTARSRKTTRKATSRKKRQNTRTVKLVLEQVAPMTAEEELQERFSGIVKKKRKAIF